MQIPQINQTKFNPLLINLDIKKELKKLKNFQEIKIVYFGTPDHSALLLEKLINSLSNPQQPLPYQPEIYMPFYKITIKLVVTSKDKALGRKKTPTPSPVALTAQKYGIPVLKPDKLDNEFVKNHLSLLNSDLFVVASYGEILPKNVLEIPRLGSINIHPSKLPKYRGPSPIQSQILDGVTDSAISFILMDEEMDHGPILHQEDFKILETDTFESLCQKMFAKSAGLLPQVIKDFSEGKITPVIQNSAMASFCSTLKKESGYFDIDNPPDPEKLDRMIRAYYPWPGCWTRWNNKIIKLLPSHPALDAGSRKNSLDSMLEFTPDLIRGWNDILLQMEGKKAVTIKEFLNGYPDFPLNILPLT